MDPTAARPSAVARSFPDGVPTLLDPAAGVVLRAATEADLAGLVEQSRDPETLRWTSNVPAPPGGYQLSHAREFLGVMASGWQDGSHASWVVAAERDGVRQFCGTVSLRMSGDGLGEIGFALHPAARGRSLMSASVRLVCAWGFGVAGLSAIRWRAKAGNWASRRVAAAAGFVFDGLVRQLLVQRGTPVDGWVATLLRDDPRTPVPWLDPVELPGAGVVLRPFAESDVDRITEACADERTRHWLVSLPRPYGRDDALSYLEATRELAARCTGIVWCVADATSGVCLGAISLEGLGTYAPRGEIGYWAHPDARGRGVITEAVRLVTRHAERTGLARSIAIRCAADNRASRYAATAAGYHEVGVLRAAEPVGDGTLSDLVLYAHP